MDSYKIIVAISHNNNLYCNLKIMRIFQHENGLFASKAFSGKRDGTGREATQATRTQ